ARLTTHTSVPVRGPASARVRPRAGLRTARRHRCFGDARCRRTKRQRARLRENSRAPRGGLVVDHELRRGAGPGAGSRVLRDIADGAGPFMAAHPARTALLVVYAPA